MLRICRTDAGSLPIAVLLVAVGTALSAVIASTTMARTASVRAATDSSRVLDAAQAGLETVLAGIRAAVDAIGQGSLVALPCGPVNGVVSATDPDTFAVAVSYKTVGNNTLSCVSGAGPPAIPAFADLVSAGHDPVTGRSRTLTARYTIRTSNQNIPGGLVRTVAQVGGQSLCLDAGSANPAPGTNVRLQPCSSGSGQQTFAYTASLYLQLVSSVSDSLPLGMCIDGGPVPHPNTDVLVTMQPCAAKVSARQQWGFDDNSYYEGTSDGVNLDWHCLNPQVQNMVGSPVVLQSWCYYDYNPDSSTGAGAAGPATSQMVNYGEFGRCLDVANFNWQSAMFYIWPCKQAPSVAAVAWNEKWLLPTVVAGAGGTDGFIVNYPSYLSFPACLHSPLSAAQWSYVTLQQCPAGPATGAFRWKVFGDTGTYATSYTIVDDAGNCLAAADMSLPGGDIQVYGHDISPPVTAACDGSTLQKWNADPNVLDASPLSMVTEK